jgi:hypothetical protein
MGVKFLPESDWKDTLEEQTAQNNIGISKLSVTLITIPSSCKAC